MSLKPIVIGSLMVFALSGQQATAAVHSANAIAVKEISSVSTNQDFRLVTINANTRLYRVTFEKPCSALRHSDISFESLDNAELVAGTVLKVGTGNCVIKSIARDIDLPAISTARDYKDPRQQLTQPTGFRSIL